MTKVTATMRRKLGYSTIAGRCGFHLLRNGVVVGHGGDAEAIDRLILSWHPWLEHDPSDLEVYYHAQEYGLGMAEAREDMRSGQ